MLLWEAVQRLQARRLRRGAGLAALADALGRSGHPIRRETLSRVLNGKQRTSWETAEALAGILDVDLSDLRDRLPDAAGGDERRAAGERRRG